MRHPQLRRFLKWVANIMTPMNHDYRRWERKNKLLRLAGLDIGERVAIGIEFACLSGQEENIRIEGYCAIGSGIKIWNFGEVTIGRFSMFAADVTLVNGWHDKNTLEPCSGSIVIGKGCWIGNGARVVGAVTIGDNSIIGAGALVVHDVPAESIVAGVPAKVIGKRVLPEKVWHLGNEYFSPVTFERVA